MLSIILNILKILGIILLVLLGLILVILLLILFFPICYRIKAQKNPATAPNSTNELNSSESALVNADIKAWWLFGLIRAKYRYPKPGTVKIKFLFFTLYDSGADSNEDVKIDREKNSDYESSVSGSTINTTTQSAQGNRTDQVSLEKTKSNRFSSQNKETIPQNSEEELTTSQNIGLFEKLQYTIEKICDKIKDIFTKIKDIRENITYYKDILTDEDTKGLLKHALNRLGKIWKSLRPRKLRANVLYGAASPDTTGYVCAVYGMIAHYLGKHVIFTPDFENEIFEGNVYAKGHTTIFSLLWNLLMIARDKRLWKLRNKLNQDSKIT